LQIEYVSSILKGKGITHGRIIPVQELMKAQKEEQTEHIWKEHICGRSPFEPQ
jgi:hypothetical protein